MWSNSVYLDRTATALHCIFVAILETASALQCSAVQCRAVQTASCRSLVPTRYTSQPFHLNHSPWAYFTLRKFPLRFVLPYTGRPYRRAISPQAHATSVTLYLSVSSIVIHIILNMVTIPGPQVSTQTNYEVTDGNAEILFHFPI